MSGTERELLVETVEGLLHGAGFGDPPTEGAAQQAWKLFAEYGLTLVGVPEDRNGSGGTFEDASAVVRVVAAEAGPGAFAEALLVAQPFQMRTGWVPSDAPVTFADGTWRLDRDSAGFTLSGHARRVPWARVAERIVMPASDDAGQRYLVEVPTSELDVVHGTNVADEPRDDVAAEGVILRDGRVREIDDRHPAADVEMWGARARSVQISGALGAVLEMTVRYAGERVQFGRPIARFQAVQQHIAALAGEVVAARAAVSAAVTDDGEIDPVSTAAAKIRAGIAASNAAALAHQVHGAIGFTQEHRLHRLTRRLWSWREEFGNELYWSRRLGEWIVERGADGLWPLITSTSRSVVP